MMKYLLRGWRWPSLGLAVVLLLLPALVLAGNRHSKLPKPGEFNPDHKTVEMFEAIEKGEIGVKLIPKDSTECRVLIENKTKQPLNVKLPEAFAGVPVLAQAAGPGNLGLGGLGGNNRANRNWGGGGTQGFGGGMGGMGGMGMMPGMGMGFNIPPEKVGQNPMALFNVAPEKVGKLKVTTVCLEHGKPDPRPAAKYEIKPIEQFTDKKGVHELCRMLGSGRINQRAAQVAAWHLNNEMSWQELAAKQLRFANGTRRPYFSPQELKVGMQITAVATNLARQREKQQKSPGEATSLSSK